LSVRHCRDGERRENNAFAHWNVEPLNALAASSDKETGGGKINLAFGETAMYIKSSLALFGLTVALATSSAAFAMPLMHVAPTMHVAPHYVPHSTFNANGGNGGNHNTNFSGNGGFGGSITHAGRAPQGTTANANGGNGGNYNRNNSGNGGDGGSISFDGGRRYQPYGTSTFNANGGRGGNYNRNDSGNGGFGGSITGAGRAPRGTTANANGGNGGNHNSNNSGNGGGGGSISF
jgi:hypothetical protein